MSAQRDEQIDRVSEKPETGGVSLVEDSSDVDNMPPISSFVLEGSRLETKVNEQTNERRLAFCLFL